MSRNPKESRQKPASAADKRAERLADALRANLKRRKAAGRETARKSPDDEE